MEHPCPICMRFHNLKKNCNEAKGSPTASVNAVRDLPKTYLKLIKNNIKPSFFFFIGPRGHGKTCYLSSLFKILHKEIFRGFCISALDQETLDKIELNYIKPLSLGQLPPATSVMFPEPMLIKLSKFVKLAKTLFFFYPKLKLDTHLFVFYDAAGEIFDKSDDITSYIPVIEAVSTLIFIVDLPGLLESNSYQWENVCGDLTKLVNTVSISVDDSKNKNIIVTFSKADLMWDDDKYGILSERLDGTIFPLDLDYVKQHLIDLENRSTLISSFFRDSKCSTFVNFLEENFKSVKYLSFSALGDAPKNNLLNYAPSNVLDPILMLLKQEERL